MLYQVSFNIHILLVMTFIVNLLVLSDVTFLWGQLMRVFFVIHGAAGKREACSRNSCKELEVTCRNANGLYVCAEMPF